MEIQFKTKNKKQLEACEYWIDNTTEMILFGGAKGGGKSYLGVSLIFADALIYPETNYFIARKELNDLRKFTMSTVYEVFKNWNLDINKYLSFNGQDNVFYLNNGSKVFFLACKEEPSDPLFERFGSMQMTRGMLEEAGEIAEAAKSNLWLSIGRWKNNEYNLKKKLLITANPKKGWMKRDFVDKFLDGTLEETKKYIQALSTDNPYLPKDYIDTLRNEKDEVRRQRLFYGDWDYEEDKDSLITNDALTDLFSNTVVDNGQKYMTVDVARLGKDSTVVSIWEGLTCILIKKYQKQTIQQTVQTIKGLAIDYKIPYSNIIVDEDGVGGGVVDYLFGVKGFVANSSPLPTQNEIRIKESKIKNEYLPKPNFANLKSQCGYKLAEMINERRISCKVDSLTGEIMEDLAATLKNKNVDSDGKLAIKSKVDIKNELGRSPDVGDTFIFRAYFELYNLAIPQGLPEHVVTLQKNKFMLNKNNMSMNNAK